MRTTLNLEDEEFSYAQAYAQARAMKLGDAVSEIIRKMRKSANARPHPAKAKLGMRHIAIEGTDGLWVFDTPSDAPKISAEEVARLIAQSEQEEDDRSIEFARTGKFPS